MHFASKYIIQENMEFARLKDEYEYCNQNPTQFRLDCDEVVRSTKREIENLNFLQFSRKKELQEILSVVENMSDYWDRFDNMVDKLKTEYIKAGYVGKAVNQLMGDIKNIIERMNIQNMSNPGYLSIFLTCTEDYIVIKNTGKTKYYSGDGALGSIPIGGAILYEGNVNYYSYCSRMAYLHGIASLIEGKPMPVQGSVYKTDVQMFDANNSVPVERIWLFG